MIIILFRGLYRGDARPLRLERNPALRNTPVLWRERRMILSGGGCGGGGGGSGDGDGGGDRDEGVLCDYLSVW